MNLNVHVTVHVDVPVAILVDVPVVVPVDVNVDIHVDIWKKQLSKPEGKVKSRARPQKQGLHTAPFYFGSIPDRKV